MLPVSRLAVALLLLAAAFNSSAQCVLTALTIDSFTELGGPSSAAWSIGTGQNPQVAQGTAQFTAQDPYYDHMLCLEAGCYTVLVQVGMIPVNPEALEISLSVGGNALQQSGYTEIMGLIIFEICIPQPVTCPQEIQVIQQSCNTYVFWIPNAAGVQIQWGFGEGVSQIAGAEVVHTFPGNGNYTITALLETPTCPQGIQLSTALQISCNGNNDCPTQINTNMVDCDSFVFWVPGVSGVQGEWTFGDGTSQISGLEVAHSFPGNGSYTVTVMLETPACPQGVLLSTTVNVDCQNPNCPQLLEYANPECGWYIIHVAGSWPNEPNTQWFINNSSVSAGTGSSFVFEPNEPGGYLITAHYTSELCGSVNLQIEISFAGCGEGPCSFDVQSSSLGGGWWQFNAIGNAAQNQVYWEVDGEPLSTGAPSIIQLLSPGGHLICGMAETPDCPMGVIDCVEVFTEETEGCNQNELVINLSGNYAGVSGVDALEFFLSLNGIEMQSIPIVLSGGVEPEFSFCIPNGCYGVAIVLPLPAVANVISCFVTLNGEPLQIMSIVQGSEGGFTQLGIGVDCTVEIDELPGVNWMVYPNPVSDILSIRRNTRDTEIAELYDLTGRLIQRWILTNELETVDVSSLNSGSYIVRIGGHTSRVMVSH